MATPELDDVLIYARSKAGRAEQKHVDLYQIGSETFTSRDAAMATATTVARKRSVSIWLVGNSGEPAELLRSYRPAKAREPQNE